MRSSAPSALPPAAIIHFPGFWELTELVRGIINDPFDPEIHRRIHNARVAREKGTSSASTGKAKIVLRDISLSVRGEDSRRALCEQTWTIAISLADSERKIQADKKASQKCKALERIDGLLCLVGA